MRAAMAPVFASTRCTLPSAALAIHTDPNAGTGRMGLGSSTTGPNVGSATGAGRVHNETAAITAPSTIERTPQR